MWEMHAAPPAGGASAQSDPSPAPARRRWPSPTSPRRRRSAVGQPGGDRGRGALRVRRALPRRGRRTVGAWCFADHMGPADVTENSGLDIGAAPAHRAADRHLAGRRPGPAPRQPRLRAGHRARPAEPHDGRRRGSPTREEATGHYRGTLEGIQLWIAQPDAHPAGAPAFEHHAELPQVELDRRASPPCSSATSPAWPARPGTTRRSSASTWLCRRLDACRCGRTSSTRSSCCEGAAAVQGQLVEPGRSATSGAAARSCRSTREPARALLLGGEPFDEPMVMWWNFVGRTREEIDQRLRVLARRDDRSGGCARRCRASLRPPPYWTAAQP